MSGKTIDIGKHALLRVGDAQVQSIVLSDMHGHEVPVINKEVDATESTTLLLGARKFIHNGRLYLQLGNHIYSASGILIQ